MLTEGAMNAAFRTPLTTPQIREILAGYPPDRVDCALLRRAAPARASARVAARISPRAAAPGDSRAPTAGWRDGVLSGER